MKILFLDDSYQQKQGYLGYGGYCLDGAFVRELAAELAQVKRKHKVPTNVELKWSPPRNHFLKTEFKGVRRDLYADALGLLEQFNARVVCATHSLDDCYGVALHGWDRSRASLWAAKQQLTFLAERYEQNYLEPHEDCGLIVSDEYGSRDGEESLIRNFSWDMLLGTPYRRLDRIMMVPLTAKTHLAVQLQLADIVVGVIVSALAGSKYGAELFPIVAARLMWNPHKGAKAFVSTFSAAVLGYGIKLFPRGVSPPGLQVLRATDKEWIVDTTGPRKRVPVQAAGS